MYKYLYIFIYNKIMDINKYIEPFRNLNNRYSSLKITSSNDNMNALSGIRNMLSFISETIYNLNGLSLIKLELDLQTAIYHIYDNDPYLNQEYGGSSNNYIKVLNYLESNYNIKDISYTKAYQNIKTYKQKLINEIYDLKQFFISDIHRSYFIPFGTNKHFTIIFLSKLTDNIIKAVYINTGEGVDTSVLNKDSHYDLYKTIYFDSRLSSAFIHFIKPFLFIRNHKPNRDLNDNELKEKLLDYTMFIACDELINTAIIKDFNENDIRKFTKSGNNYEAWALLMFDTLDSKTDNYKYINDFFSLKNKTALISNPDNIELIRKHETELSDDYRTINEIWFKSNDVNLNSSDESFKTFLLKSYDNVKFIFHENKLLFKLQEAGSCTYKSIILSIFYYLLSNVYNPKLINEFYFNLSKKNHEALTKYYDNHINNEYGLKSAPFYYISLTDKLLNDKILLDNDKFNHINIINKNLVNLNKTPLFYNKQKNTKSYEVYKNMLLSFDIDEINNIINDMRNDKSKSKIEEDIRRKIYEYKNTTDKDISIAYLELMFLSLLFEFYYNFEFWEKSDKLHTELLRFNYYRYNFRLPLEISNYTRLDLTKDELLFIFYFALAINKNSVYRIDKTIILKDFINVKLIEENNILFNKRIKQDSSPEYIDSLLLLIMNYKSNPLFDRYSKYNIVIDDKEITNYDYLIIQIINDIKNKYYTVNDINIDFLVVFLYDGYYNINRYLTKDEKYNIIKKIFKYLGIANFESPKHYNFYSKLLELTNLILDEYFFVFNSTSKGNNFERISYQIIGDNKKQVNSIRILNQEMIKYVFDKILKAFNEDIIINDSVILNILDSYEIRVNNKYFKYENDSCSILKHDGTYQKKDFTIIRELDNRFILGNLLFHNEDDYCFLSNEELIIITNYKEEQLIIQFNISIRPGNAFVLSNDMFINLSKVELSNNLIKYPFLVHVPKLALNFITIDELNNIGVYTINNYKNKQDRFIRNYYSYNNEGIFYDITSDEQTKEYLYLSIKDNYLTPVLNNLNFIDKLNNMYKKYGKLRSYINNTNTIIEDISVDIVSYSLNKIDEILDITDVEIEDILKLIGNFVDSDDMHLVKWLNGSKVPIISSKDYGKEAKYNCDANCDNIRDHSSRILKLIDKLKKLLILLTSKINHDERINSYVDFLDKNIQICPYVMKTNIYIKNLLRLNNIILNCENKISCHEILEINELFNKYDYKGSKLSRIVEIIFGNIIRKEQWEKIDSIYQNYIESRKNPNNKYEIHQFMMGKGKSSLITPMLVVLIKMGLVKLENFNIYIIVPSHLIEQTKMTFIEYENIFNLKQIILSDNDIKLKFLNKELKDNDIYIIDEFDYMYNPLQSNFNIIENEEIIDRDLIEYIYIYTNLVLVNKLTMPYDKYSIEEEIMDIIKNHNIKFIKNVSYGMSNDYKNRISIPYLRKDSPLEGSKFSSNIITIVLTILYFYNIEFNCFILELPDIKFIKNHNKNLFKKIFTHFYPKLKNVDDLDENLYLQETMESKISLPKEYIKEYILLLFSSYNESKTIRNCSFIDIINKKSTWQIGYSGTVNIDIPARQIDNYNKIIADPDEFSNVKEGILAKENTINISIGEINQLLEQLNKIKLQNIDNELLKKLIKFDVIIDCCAIFKDIDNTQFALLLNAKTNKPVIFLLSDNTKKICKGGIILNYEYFPYKKGEVIYYYSQKHIVGIDFKQSNILEGLLIVNDSNKYTEVAQAIYRMRKLNKGHSCNIAMFNNDRIQNTKQILDLILKNELEFNKSNSKLLFYQYFKCYNRQIINNFTEQELLPLYFYENPAKQLRNIIEYKMLMNTKPQLENPFIKGLYKQLLEYSTEDLLKIIFSTNTTENSVEKETFSEKTVESETQVITQTVVLNKEARTDYDFIIPIVYNPLVELNHFKERFIFFDLSYTKESNNIEILFSYNLFDRFIIANANTIEKQRDTFIIIKLEDSKDKSKIVYLIEHMSTLNHYMPIAPIYNNKGVLINDYIFSNEITKININILNIAFKNIKININLGKILFNIEEPPTIIPITKETFNKLVLLIYYSGLDVFNKRNTDIEMICKYYNNDIEPEYKLPFPSFRIRYIMSLLENYYNYIKSYIEVIPLHEKLDTRTKSIDFMNDKIRRNELKRFPFRLNIKIIEK